MSTFKSINFKIWNRNWGLRKD